MGITGKRVAFLLTDGFEDSELTSPWTAVAAGGATPVLVAPAAGEVKGKKGYSQSVDLVVDAADAAVFDALVLPGGVINADQLRMNQASIAFARAFFTQNKPVGVICHGAWILVETGELGGRTMTSYSSLRTDLRDAGANWVDEEVVVDRGLISSRTPADLPAFNAKVIEEIATTRLVS